MLVNQAIKLSPETPQRLLFDTKVSNSNSCRMMIKLEFEGSEDSGVQSMCGSLSSFLLYQVLD